MIARRGAFSIAIVGLVISQLSAQTAKSSAAVVEYPLEPGTKWRYQLRQELGPGVSFGEEDAPFVKGNVLEAAIVAEVKGKEPVGGAQYTRVESMRAGKRWLTEWYRVSNDGLLLGKTLDSQTGPEIVMTPPQRLLSPGAQAGQSWTWKAADAPVRMTTRVVGPARVTVPAGSFDTTATSHTMTIDIGDGIINVRQNRWFTPGIGYVRQETETRSGSRLLSRVALALVSFEKGSR